ncbi:hypothetical protein M1437_01555 [Patescibacteria group bacterium]|nr:hypothetical protein [Patescibacteria group bacterium]
MITTIKTQMRQNFKNFIFIFIVFLLLPSLVSAQNIDEKITALAEEDCKKIAKRLGDPVPTVNVESNFGIPFNSCLFKKISSSEDEGLYYASKTIEDVKMTVPEIEFRRYSTAENAGNDLSKEMNNISEHIAQDIKDRVIVNAEFMSVRKVPDGYVYVSKFYSGALYDKTSLVSDGSIHLLKGSCYVRVDVSNPEYGLRNAYHKNETVNPHPEFNHDREVEVLELARQKAEEILNLVDCDNGVPSSKSNSLNKSNYTQALVIEPPKKDDFQKILRSGFKKVNPVSTASAIPKSATESANLTGTTFFGKVDGDDTLMLQLPDGKEIELKDDKTALEIKRPSRFRFRNFKGSGSNYIAPKQHVYVKEIDCHILLEQERRDQEMIKRLGGIIYASDWSVDETVIVKPTGDCSYTNEGGPVRVFVEQGQATFKTPGGDGVSAENADFGIGYNAKSAISIFEVYNGSITVTNPAGNAKTISATYGSGINRIEIDKDGVMSEKIAIPLSQWQAFLASKQEKKDEAKGNTLPIVGAIAVLGLGGIVFFLYRTSKLQSLFKISKQKITDILGKINREKKTD